MKLDKDTLAQFRYDGTRDFNVADVPTNVAPLYKSETDRGKQLDALAERMDQAQNRMHAHGKYGLLVLFQAMDAAGKDSSIRHVFKGVNPSRFRVASFKKPSEKEQQHDWLWRFWQTLPERGTIGIFNRTYYEEVIAPNVHPEFLDDTCLPDECLTKTDQLWQDRYADIRNMEDYLHRNGFRILKFFLNVAKEEQGKRLIARLEDTEKQWKLSENDLNERQHWPEYMAAYEAAIQQTATERCPWYVVPSDDRQNQQLIIAHIVAETLESLPITFPEKDKREADKLIKEIQRQDA